MSIGLMTLAFKTTLPSTQKFVLVALCDSANDQGECYPSVSVVAEKCSLSERAVQSAIASLEGVGFLRREFRTGRSTVYWINATPAGYAPPPRTSCTPARRAPPQDVHLTPAAPAPGGEPPAPPPPQDVHLTPAAPAPRTIKEPSVEPSLEPSGRRVSAKRPHDVTEQTWDDFNALRRRKRAPVTETVMEGAREEAEKASLTLERFLKVWCVRGSQGLQASWLKPEERGATAAPGRRTSTDIADINARNTEEAHRRLFGHQEIIDA